MPVVLELGPRDLAAGNVVLKRRDTGVKEILPQTQLAARLPEVLDQMQKDLYAAAKQRQKDNTVLANSIGEVEEILREVSAGKGGGKFVMAHVKDDPAVDARMKEFKATVRCIPSVDEFDGPGKCIVTGETVDRRAVTRCRIASPGVSKFLATANPLVAPAVLPPVLCKYRKNRRQDRRPYKNERNAFCALDAINCGSYSWTTVCTVTEATLFTLNTNVLGFFIPHST